MGVFGRVVGYEVEVEGERGEGDGLDAVGGEEGERVKAQALRKDIGGVNIYK